MSGPHVYSDEYIEHYAERYRSLALKAQGLTLLQYLAAPEACERLAARYAARRARCEPLLLPQEIARAAAALETRHRVEARIEAVPRRDGWAIEGLRHHSRKAIGWKISRRVA